MIVAVISDTHSRALPRACIERLEAADVILHAGDVATLDDLRALQALGKPVHAVHGNVDDAGVRARLPLQRTLDLDGVTIGMIHDAGPKTGRLPRLHRRFPAAHAVVFGHSHIPLHEQDPRTGFQIFNPGSPTDRRRQPHHTMGIATIAGGAIAFKVITLDDVSTSRV
ncbi:MAG TPA: metallophosphoesterase family protein [Solirubrobacter sp.]|nr:metallophosphoesterase family protein [Solirubrobacter sp.]